MNLKVILLFYFTFYRMTNSENSFLNYNIEDDNKDKNLNDELDEEWY